jgi:hypothetical protein
VQSTDGVDEFHRPAIADVRVIDLGRIPVERRTFEVVTQKVHSSGVGAVPTYVVGPQPVKELVEPSAKTRRAICYPNIYSVRQFLGVLYPQEPTFLDRPSNQQYV